MSYTWTTGETITAEKLNNTCVSGLCTIDSEFELNKSFNDLLAMLNAGVIPYFLFNENSAMMIAQLQSYEYQENESYTAYFGSYDGWQAVLISSNPDAPMVMD